MGSELGQLIEEPPGGANHGRRLADNPNVEGRHLRLEVSRWKAAEFMRAKGWGALRERAQRPSVSGMGSHLVNQHTVLHPDDYVDEELLAALVEDELGFSAEQLHSVYSTGGRIPSDRRGLRDRIDARLLALSRGGANMDLFGRVTGLNGSTVDRALARARAEEAA